MSHDVEVRLERHDSMLREKVFQVESKWPNFRLMLEDIAALASEMPDGASVVTFERGLLYGGYSLIGPYFHRQSLISIDCSPESADDRGDYNAGMVDDDRFWPVPVTRRARIVETGLADGQADLILVPNLVHHVADQEQLFLEMARVLKTGGRVYIYEPLVRELHQAPDDFIRYTPFGMARMLEKNGLSVLQSKEDGAAFSAIAYCWTQALEYFPEAKRKEMSDWFYNEHFPQLMAWDEEHPENQCREHTRFPMAFSLLAEKTA
jgi:SAM-dependent methyltransferase